MGSPIKQSKHALEWFVLAIVVLASTALGVDPIAEPIDELEIDTIHGSIILSTRSSMAALGLGEEIETGAVATVSLVVNTITSEGCIDCENIPTGIQINGDIEIQNIRGGIGGLGRVEGTLNITYLREYVDENFIGKEWFSINWNASGGSELDTSWEIIIIHDPPKWNLDERYNAAFISNSKGEESRTGPWLLTETLLNETQNVQGCLPNSLSCEKSGEPDISLISTKKPNSIPLLIPHPDELMEIKDVESTNESPSEMSSLRQLLNVENEVESHNIWCPQNQGEIIAKKSWSLGVSNNNLIAPMSFWFDVLNLPSTSFNQVSGTWTEIKFDSLSCATVVDEDNNYKIGIITK